MFPTKLINTIFTQHLYGNTPPVCQCRVDINEIRESFEVQWIHTYEIGLDWQHNDGIYLWFVQNWAILLVWSDLSKSFNSVVISVFVLVSCLHDICQCKNGIFNMMELSQKLIHKWNNLFRDKRVVFRKMEFEIW